MLGLEKLPLGVGIGYGFMWNVGVDYKIPEFPMNVSIEYTPRMRWARGQLIFGQKITYRVIEPGLVYLSLRFTDFQNLFNF